MLEDNFIELIRGLNGMEIGVFLSDNQYIEGTLMSVQLDHLIVNVNQNTFYIPHNQIKAFSKNAKNSKLLLNESEQSPFNKENLEEILKRMRFQWITINSFNDTTFSGILSRITEDYILVSNDDKQFFIRKSQIMNIYNGNLEGVENLTEENHENSGNEQQGENTIQIEGSQLTEAEHENNQTAEEKQSTLTAKRSKKLNKLNKKRMQRAKMITQKKSTNKANSNPQTNSIQTEELIVKRKTKKTSTHNKRFSLKFNSPMISTAQKDEEEQEQPFESSTNELETTNGLEVELEVNTQPEPTLSLKEKKLILEYQYYALMKYAQRKNRLEQQYVTLMKHAEKMYCQLRDERLFNEA